VSAGAPPAASGGQPLPPAAIVILVTTPSFAALARQSAPSLDHLALALAAEFHDVDAAAALAALDALGEELAATLRAKEATPPAALTAVLGERHGFHPPPDGEESPDDALLDRVLATRRGGPPALCAVYAEAARRARLPVWGVRVDHHVVVGWFGARPPVLLDPCVGGRRLPEPLAPRPARPRTTHELALGLLDELVNAFLEAGETARATRAAELRLELPLPAPHGDVRQRELLALRAHMN